MNRIAALVVAAGVAGLLLCVWPAAAQVPPSAPGPTIPSAPAAPPEPAPIERLAPVLVTAPAPLPETLPRSSVPGWLDILGGDEVTSGRPRGLPGALERLPGVTLQNEQGNSYQPDVSLRGFVASPVTGLPQGVSVFLDGVRSTST